jgi:integrase
MRIRFTLRKPVGARKTFSIEKDIKYPDGRREQSIVRDSDLESLNISLKSKVLTAAEIELEIRTNIIPRLKRVVGVRDRVLVEAQLSDHNFKVFQTFWDSEYVAKNLIAPDTARHEFIRALRAIEPLSISSVDKTQINKKLKAGRSTNSFRKLGIRVNQLLTYLERGFTLDLPEVEYLPIRYLTEQDFDSLLLQLPSKIHKLFATVLFATGVRTGEAFALHSRSVLPNGSIFISRQLDRKRLLRQVKNKKEHNTIVIPKYLEAVKEWCEVPNKEDFRNTLNKEITKAAKAAFKDKARRIRPHDLRHSYAVYMLGMGCTLTEISFFIGDDEITCRKYYLGYVMSDATIDRVNRLLNSK